MVIATSNTNIKSTWRPSPYFGRRVGGPLDEVLAAHRGQTVAVVAHNIVNRVYVARLMGWPLSRAREIRQDNTGINVIRGRDDEITLMSFNVRFHLDDAGL